MGCITNDPLFFPVLTMETGTKDVYIVSSHHHFIFIYSCNLCTAFDFGQYGMMANDVKVQKTSDFVRPLALFVGNIMRTKREIENVWFVRWTELEERFENG